MDRPQKYHIDDAVLMWAYAAEEAEKYFTHLEAELARANRQLLDIHREAGKSVHCPPSPIDAYRMLKAELTRARAELHNQNEVVAIADGHITRLKAELANYKHWRETACQYADKVEAELADTKKVYEAHATEAEKQIDELIALHKRLVGGVGRLTESIQFRRVPKESPRPPIRDKGEVDMSDRLDFVRSLELTVKGAHDEGYRKGVETLRNTMITKKIRGAWSGSRDFVKGADRVIDDLREEANKLLTEQEK